MQDSSAATTLEEALREGLVHLYDPEWSPAARLCQSLGCAPDAATEQVRQAMLRVIEDFAPTQGVPATTRLRRLYDILVYRYVQGLTQEQVSERLNITVRHLRREQQWAIHLLATRLAEQHGDRDVHPLPTLADAVEMAQEAQTTMPLTSAWHAQVREELDVLQRGAPGSVADVRAALVAVLPLAQTLAAQRQVTLHLGAVSAGLFVAVHPSALRQILLSDLTELVQRMWLGQLMLTAWREGQRVLLQCAAHPASAHDYRGDRSSAALAEMQGGAMRWWAEGNRVFSVLDLPSADKVTVLVVDDNDDVTHCYERYAQGTRYQIVATHEGATVMEIVGSLRPDAIILDVMLPDMDGWELLVALHASPATQVIPVIICSVVREAELALALGAALYVPKPIRRPEFLQALDVVLHQAASTPPPAPAHSATAC